jgi:hypothetical protein
MYLSYLSLNAVSIFFSKLIKQNKYGRWGQDKEMKEKKWRTQKVMN